MKEGTAWRRFLTVLIVGELAMLGGLVGWRWLRPAAALPAAVADDPLLGGEFADLARAATRGAAEDWQRLGEALLGQGQYRHAEAAFRRAAMLDPQSLDACYGLAYCIDRTGRMAESNPHYRRCLTLPDPPPGGPPKKGVALYEIGRNHLREGDLAAAEATFRENIGFWSAEYQLAKLLVHSGRPREAEGIIDRLITKLPLALELHALRARILDVLGRPDEALAARAMAERGAHLLEFNYSTVFVQPFTVRHGLGKLVEACEARVAAGDVDGAGRCLAVLDAAIAGRPLPERATAESLRARIALMAGKPHQAVNAVRAEWNRGNHDPSLGAIEADALDELGRSDEATALRESLAQVSPTADFYRKLASAPELAGNPKQRDQWLGRAAFLDGMAAYRRNDLETALDRFTAATRLYPHDANAWIRRGEIEWHMREFRTATDSFGQDTVRQRSSDRINRWMRLTSTTDGQRLGGGTAQ
jgi:tetratricopeptide (TPR) repeat protein